MNCPSGHPNADGMTFCTQCGMRMAPNPSSPIPPVAPLSQSFNQPTNSGNPFETVAPIWPSPDSQLQPMSQHSQNKNSNRNIAIISVVSTLLVVLLIFFVATNRSTDSGTANAPEEDLPTTQMVTVSLTVMNDLDGCDLPLGYFDIPGGQFELRADGQVVGFGSFPLNGMDLSFACKFTSTVFNVPDDAAVYSVALANGRRGTIYNTRDELAGKDWVFDLSLN